MQQSMVALAIAMPGSNCPPATLPCAATKGAQELTRSWPGEAMDRMNKQPTERETVTV
jgi:hypothetical protein